MTLTLLDISHDFGDLPVLHQVTFSVKPGEVHALLGMNGAGKSTLLHIAAGVYQPVRGTINIDGERVLFRSTSDANAHGVVFLTQEVDRGLVPQLAVHENLTIGHLRQEKAIWFSKSANRARARALLQEYGLDLNVDLPVKELSLYEKQMLSIIRAVSNQARYLLLDEPTASLDRLQAVKFYELVQKLQLQGLGIVLISHKLHEIMACCQQITVLRGGVTVMERSVDNNLKLEDIIEAMTGGAKGIARRVVKDGEQQPVQLAVRTTGNRSDDLGIKFEIRKGEIVTLFGLLGSGKTELAETLFGLHDAYTAVIEGKQVTIRNTRQAVEQGFAFIPEERGRHGVWKKDDIRTHLALSFRGMIHVSKELAYSQERIRSFAIRPDSPTYRVGRLSGGNQQKVAIAKWFAKPRKIAIFDEPMKGIDVSARETIFQMIESLAAEGTSILYLTAEPEEALRISDRVWTLVDGQIVSEIEAHALTMDALMLTADKEVQRNGHR
ncbi:simple sugar transport system ATP-binding protein [Paenibacillus shirakamiensis]|uniref:Autoinducer 2 import ATP-binding protein LsrA n=1 Tax=Paenibacillus shirakamiensis TaxID=1265935 RepID=A0ABS4JIS7_9BACL|nr:sugar ABC transporter ATP-binding protein [Paenibacillus shirakamiensis]MBP2001604.1 simple sugar transport system ATP-binding protein [Paenibacillus shirakamiensis]